MFFCMALAVHAQQSTEAVYYPEPTAQDELTRRPATDELLQEASRLYNLGGFEEAILIYDRMIRNDPYHARAYFGRALCWEELVEFDKALVDYEIVRNLDPGMQEAFFNSAVLQYSLSAYEKAIPLFEALLNLPEGNTQMVYFKGVKYSEKAEPLLSGVSSLQGNDTEAIIYGYLGRSHDALGNFTEAEQYYSQAIALRPTTDLFIDRGKLRKEQERYEAAMADFKAALQIDAENSMALYLLAITAHETGDAALTIKAMDKVIAGNRAFPGAYSHRGLLKFEAGDFAGAVADYDTAISLDPGVSDAWLNRGLAKGKLKNFGGAVKDFNHVLRQDQGNYEAYLYRGNVYFQMKKYQSALKDYNNAIALNNATAHAFYNRALAKHELNQEDQVCEDLTKAISLGMKAAEKARKAYCQ